MATSPVVAGRKFQNFVGDVAGGKEIVGGVTAFPAAVLLDAGSHFIFDDATAAAQLAEAVEIARERHIRVGGVLLVGLAAFALVGSLAGAEQDDFEAASLGGNADVKAGGGGGRRLG